MKILSKLLGGMPPNESFGQPPMERKAEPTTRKGLLKRFEELGAPPRSPATFLHIVIVMVVFQLLVPSSHEDFPVLLFLMAAVVGSYFLTIRECNKVNQRIDVLWKLVQKEIEEKQSTQNSKK